MASQHAEAFMNALRDAERTGDATGLVGRFTDDAELSNLAGAGPHRGPDGVREFWADYLAFFDKIESRFTRVLEGDGFVTLEWVSDGALKTGEPVSYRGVSLLEWDGDRVAKFRTYYDSAALKPVSVGSS